MGGSTPKLLLPLGQHNIITQTVKTCCSLSAVSHVVVLCPEGEEKSFISLDHCLEGRTDLLLEVVAGGKTRKESVQRGLERVVSLSDNLDETFVAVHDGARPFVTEEIFERALQAAYKSKAVTTAIPVIDSLIRVENGSQIASLDRSKIFSVQTPQIFQLSLLLEAHQKFVEDATDDASLVERIHPVEMVEGDRRNFKVTTTEDYELAKVIISQSL